MYEGEKHQGYFANGKELRKEGLSLTYCESIFCGNYKIKK